MKGSLVVLAVFVLGIAAGWADVVPQILTEQRTSSFLLYLLIVQVGLGLGANPNLMRILRGLRPAMLLLPLATILGTLLFSALAALLIPRWRVADCLAVGSGMGYYSLSSILIADLKQASPNPHTAAELGTLALLTNIVREVMALLGASWLVRRIGWYAPISVSRAGSMDSALPLISRYAGSEVVPIAIMHGLVLEVSVPVLVTVFCRL